MVYTRDTVRASRRPTCALVEAPRPALLGRLDNAGLCAARGFYGFACPEVVIDAPSFAPFIKWKNCGSCQSA